MTGVAWGLGGNWLRQGFADAASGWRGVAEGGDRGCTGVKGGGKGSREMNLVGRAGSMLGLSCA